MVFQRIGFNDEWVKTKTESEFIAHESHHGLNEKQLKEVYALMVPPKKNIEKPNAGKADVKAPHE